MVPLKPYYMRFIIWMLIGYAALVGLNILFPGRPPNLFAAIAIPFLASAMTGEQFLKKEKRLPHENERSRLVRNCFFIYVIIQIVLSTLIFTYKYDIIGVSTGLVVGLLLVITIFLAFCYAAILLNFGTLLERSAKHKGLSETISKTFD